MNLRIKHICRLLALCSATTFNSVAGVAQDAEPRRFIDSASVPAIGATADAFVPVGWMIERRIDGDLTNDKRPDVVLQLVEREREIGADADPDENRGERYRALLVLENTADGKLSRLALAPKLLAEFGSGGMKSGTAGDNIDITISPRGVLDVAQGLGGTTTLDFIHRFRLDPAARRLRLIGVEITDGSPAYQLTQTSINLLTNRRISTHTCQDKHAREAIERARVAVRTSYIEDADVTAFGDDAAREQDRMERLPRNK